MADYKEMYFTLFRKVSKAITLLQEAQIEAEELFLSSEDAPIQIMPPHVRAFPDGEKRDNESTPGNP